MCGHGGLPRGGGRLRGRAAEVDLAGVDVDVDAGLAGAVGVEVVAHPSADENLSAAFEVREGVAALAVPIDGEPDGALRGGLAGGAWAYVFGVCDAEADVFTSAKLLHLGVAPEVPDDFNL